MPLITVKRSGIDVGDHMAGRLERCLRYVCLSFKPLGLTKETDVSVSICVEANSPSSKEAVIVMVELLFEKPEGKPERTLEVRLQLAKFLSQAVQEFYDEEFAAFVGLSRESLGGSLGHVRPVEVSVSILNLEKVAFCSTNH